MHLQVIRIKWVHTRRWLMPCDLMHQHTEHLHTPEACNRVDSDPDRPARFLSLLFSSHAARLNRAHTKKVEWSSSWPAFSIYTFKYFIRFLFPIDILDARLRMCWVGNALLKVDAESPNAKETQRHRLACTLANITSKNLMKAEDALCSLLLCPTNLLCSMRQDINSTYALFLFAASLCMWMLSLKRTRTLSALCV